MKAERQRGEVGMADLATALETLPLANEKQRTCAAACLGFAVGRDPGPAEVAMAESQRVRDRQRSLPPSHHEAPKTFAAAMPARAPVKPAGGPLPATLTSTRPSPSSRPDWVADETAVNLDATPHIENRFPLFASNAAPAILSAALGVVRPGRGIDVAGLIELIVARRPVREVPRLLDSGLELGVQMLIDTGAAMAPYRQDFDDLVKALDRVVGRSRCQVFEFRVDPASATRWTDGLVEEAWTPSSRCPVLLVSDFGALGACVGATRLGRDQWRGVVDLCAAREAPLVGLTPMPPHEKPGWLSGILLVHWDRRTRAGYVRRQIGIGHGVRRSA